MSFPFMQTTFLGGNEALNYYGGVLLLWSLGSYLWLLVNIFSQRGEYLLVKMLSFSGLFGNVITSTERETMQKIRLYPVLLEACGALVR